MVKNSSKSSKRNGKFGNTRQTSPARNWCFTINNYTKEDKEKLLSVKKELVPRYVFQEEKGAPEEVNAGTPHLQGYIDFGKGNKNRPKNLIGGILGHMRTHWEKTRNVNKSIEYCQKEYTRIGKTFRRGIRAPYKIDIILKDWQKEILAVLNEEPNEREIIYCWDASGNTGKTTFAKYIFLTYDECIMVNGAKNDMLNGVRTFCEFNGNTPRIVLINIPRDQQNRCSWSGVESIKDMFFFSPKYEGGMICGAPPHVVIFSNADIPWGTLSHDRWKEIKAS